MDEERLPLRTWVLETVRRAFALSSVGSTDAQVAGAIGLPLFTVRGMLTSLLYVGRLRDRSPAHWPPLVDEPTWEQAQAARARRATNTGRAADPRRPYALSRLHCAACGTRLTGDSGYYRHRNVCQEFVDARPPMARHGRGQSAGHAYPMDLYEQVVEGILAEAALAAPTLASVVGALVPSSARRDDAALARIAREREVALARYVRDRDSAVLDATMRALDADEARALQLREEEGVPADEAVRYLRELPETWAKARGGTGRAMVADALFERIDVLGLREATAHLTTDAVRHGLAAALPKEFGILVSGRGERNCVVMSDAGAVVRFVRATFAREHAHTA